MTLPTPQLLYWADLEHGLFFHYDIEVFDPTWNGRERFRPVPDPSLFNPRELDTDQWMRVAVDAGARYALFTAKHCTGFCMWPTDAYAYSVRASPWRGGKGDLVGEFVASCRKHGVTPGIYYATQYNAYCDVINGHVKTGDPVAQAAYDAIVVRHVEELLSRYGELVEIWFDGGTISRAQGGPDVGSVLQRLQPGIVAFEGPAEHPHDLRWAGSEHAVNRVDCWSASNRFNPGNGIVRCDPAGDPDGAVWSPAEAPMPPRDIDRAFFGGWMWREGEEGLTYDGDYLYARYCATVGRNGNLLVGALPDTRGLITEDQEASFRRLGTLLKERFGAPLAEARGGGESIVLTLPGICDVQRVVVMEDQSAGQRIRGWVLEGSWPASWPEGWFEVETGRAIGHKRILAPGPLRVHRMRFRVTDSVGMPAVRSIAVYGTRA